MPLMNGPETAKRIREMQNSKEITQDIKLVMFSGNDAFQEDYDRSIFDYFMSKPLDKKSLYKICKNLKLV